MLRTTRWAFRTWFKATAGLALLVFGVWLFASPGWFHASIVTAALVEWWVIRALCREWVYDASLRWWWN